MPEATETNKEIRASQEGALRSFITVGANLTDIRSVESHVHALGQCRRIIRRLGIKPIVAGDTAGLSRAVTAWIESRHRGDRTAAGAAAMRIVAAALPVADRSRWPAAERRALAVLAPLLALIPDLSRWPARERRRVVALARAKGGNEFRFQRRLAGHRRLQEALAAIAARH